MIRESRVYRTLIGATDLIWVAVMTVCAVVVVGFLVHHLRMKFQVDRAAYERAAELSDHRRLVEERRHLDLERHVRAQRLGLDDVAEQSLGMVPVLPEHIVLVGGEE